MFNLFNRGTPYPFESEGFRAAHVCARSDVCARSSAAFADSPRAELADNGTTEEGTFIPLPHHAARALPVALPVP